MTRLLQSQTRIVSAFLLGEELTKADYAVTGVAMDIIAPHVKEREHLKGFAELSADLESNGMINPIISYPIQNTIMKWQVEESLKIYYASMTQVS